MKKIYAGLLLLFFSFVARAQFPAPYCAEVFNSGTEPITSVVFNTINNTSPASISGAPQHQDFTSISTTVTQGSSYTLTIKGNTDGNFQDGVRAFFDFNNNGVFTDAGEIFTIGALANSTGVDAAAVSLDITIPSTAIIGNVRMRVSKKYGAYPAPCNSSSTLNYGQAEDYTINITAPACALPTNLQFTSTTIPNATISWTAATGVSSYQYAITNSATPPASGTTTTNTSATVNNLPAGSTLFAYVRSVCSSGAFTNWVRKAYIPCTTTITPANNATNVANPITFNWTPVAGITNYQILISTDNGITYPLTGVFSNPPVVAVTGLGYGVSYKWYVRGIYGSDTAAVACASSTATTFSTRNNDSCGSAQPLLPGTPLITGNIGATQSMTAASCAAGSPPLHDVWYSFVADNNGSVTISLTNADADFDGVLVAYSGACSSLTSIGCTDLGYEGDSETLTVNSLVAGQTYYIRVYDWDLGGTYTLTITGSALPVTGVNLSATRNGKNVQLGWQTLTEMNNTGFEIQRSADGSSYASFLKVGSKAAGGNSSAAINYTAEDAKPFAGANYYRLKQTDKDGKVNYSNVVFVKGLAVSNLTLSAVYPNPTHDVLKAAIQSPAAEKVTFVISDMMGKVISRQVSSVNTGDNTVNLNVANLPSGNYLLKATCSNGCETAVQKFTKQ